MLRFNSVSDRRAWKFMLSERLSKDPYRSEGLVPSITCFVKMQERTKEDVPEILRSVRREQDVPSLSEEDVLLLTCQAATNIFPERFRIGALTQLIKGMVVATSYISYKDALNLIPLKGQKAMCRAIEGDKVKEYDFPYIKWMDFITLYGSYFLSTHFVDKRDWHTLKRNINRNGGFLGDMSTTTDMSHGGKKKIGKERKIRLFHPDLELSRTKPYLYATQDYLVLAHEATHYLQSVGLVPIRWDTAAEAIATLALFSKGMRAEQNDVSGHDEKSLFEDKLDYYSKGTLIGKLAIGSSDPPGRMRELLEADEKRRKERHGLA